MNSSTTTRHVRRGIAGLILGLTLGLVATTFATAWAAPLFEENFNYAAGSNLLGQGGWIQTGTHATPVITVSAPSLSYPAYPSSGIGNSVLLLSGDDNNHQFTQQTSGTIYASALVNVVSSTAAGDYFLHLGPNTIGSTFAGRTFIKKDADPSTNFAFGIQYSNVGTLNYSGFNYVPGTTYLVVVKYTYVAGAANDQVDLFVNPVIGASEPAALVSSTNTGTDLANVGAVALRQGSASAAANVRVDGIRVGTTWNDVVPSYALNVTLAPPAGGTVTKAPDQASYVYGDVVTLTATANTGYTFSGFSGDVTGGSPATVTIDGNKNVTANFAAIPYTLNVSVVGNGTVTKAPNQATYIYGDVVTLTATADPGWSFAGFTGDVTGGSPATVTIDGDKNVTATFTQNTYTLNVTTVGSGTVTKAPDQATYLYGDVVTLTASPAGGWTFAGFSGDVTGGSPATVTMDGNKNVTATFTESAFSLNVSIVGSGTVAKDPDQLVYASGTVVTLTATPAAGWSFAGFTGDATGGSPATVTMDGNKNVTATFTQDTYTLNVTVVGSGTVTKEPDQATYLYGDVVTLTASPAAGWSFAGFTGDATGGSPATVTMNGNKNVTATFTQDTYTLNVSVVGSGTVTKEPDQATYVYGDVVTLTAAPAAGWTFAGFTGDVTGGSPATVTMNANKSVTATFTQNTYTLTVSVVGSGTVTKAPDLATYVYGDVVTLTAAADPGWTFAGFTGDASGGSPATVTMDANKSVTATFTQNTYTLTVTIVGSGTVTKAPDQATYVYGDVVTLTATPDGGWSFAGFSGDATGPSPVTLTINGDKNVTATFVQSAFTLNVSVVGTGTVTKDPDQLAYTSGTIVTLTATPAAGWSFAGFSGDVTGGSPATVTMDANKNVTATFTQDVYTLTVTVVGSGTVTVAPNQATYQYGDLVTLTATAAAGNHFDVWSGDASGHVSPLTVTMNGNKAITATFLADVYSWNQTGTAAWGTGTNWTPRRWAVASDDVLQFNNGATTTATGVPPEVIAQLLVSGNTTVSLQPAVGSGHLALNGGSGTDFAVASGSTLNMQSLSSPDSLIIELGASATGLVGGSIIGTGPTPTSAIGHKIWVNNTSALVFASASLIQEGAGMRGNFFGDGGAGGGMLNSVEFQGGSVFSAVSGANPFGASTPNSVVIWDKGSLYRLDGNILPSLSGRTYADFEYNVPVTLTSTGGNLWTMDNLTISQGTDNVNLTGTAVGVAVLIKGNLTVKAGATLNFGATSGTPTIQLAGSATQTITANGTLTSSTFSGMQFQVINPNNVVLATNVTWPGSIAFSSGKMITGANTLTLSSTTSNVTGAGQGTGWVAGNEQRAMTGASVAKVFDIGDMSYYTPATVALHGLSGTLTLLANTSTPDHPQIGTSHLDPAKSVNRYWTLTPTGSPTFTSYDGTFAFNAADVDAGANTGNFEVKRFSGGTWFNTTTGTRTATSTQALGVTSFSDFAIGDPLLYALNVTVVGSGTVAKAPDQTSYEFGTVVTLTATPAAGWSFAGFTGDVTGGSPATVTMDADKNVTATFTQNAYTLNVTVVGSGTVTKAPDLPTYQYGDVVTLTATPATCWHFVGWSGDATGNANPLALTIDASKSVTATFAINTYTVNVTVEGSGTVTKDPDLAQYDCGTVVTLTAAPAQDWEFVGWSGDASGTDNPLTITVDGDKNITAKFDFAVAVVITRFDAVPTDDGLKVSWLLTSPGPFASVTLERSEQQTGPWKTSDAARTTEDKMTVAVDKTVESGTTYWYRLVVQTTGGSQMTFGPIKGQAPVKAFALEMVAPNPASGPLRVNFAVAKATPIRLEVLDVQGRVMATLADGVYPAGRYQAMWDGAGNSGRVPAGLYFVRYQAAGLKFTKRVIIAR